MLNRLEIPKEGDAIGALRALIGDGRYGPGDRLPPERELMQSLGVSRTILRRALDTLEREGAIWRHVGKGTFITDSAGGVASGGLAEIGRQLSPIKLVRARLAIEPAIAREAAINASASAIQKILREKDLAAEAPTWGAYETHDDAFHRAIAEATDNVLLFALFDQLNYIRRLVSGEKIVRDSVRPPTDHTSFAEHDRIAAAIEAHDPHAAFDAMRGHIGSVSRRLFGEI